MNPSPTISLHVELRNPGQFFACCGLLELADRLWPGGAEAWFTRNTFHIAPLKQAPPEAKRNVVSLLETLWAIPFEAVETRRGLPLPANLRPLQLRLGESSQTWLELDFWLEIRADRSSITPVGTPWQLWSGQQTPFRLWRDLREGLQSLLPGLLHQPPESIFLQRFPGGGRFGFDPGPAWNALDAGFSPNEQSMRVAASPLVEMLAAVGLQRFRPRLVDRSLFSYTPWESALSPAQAVVILSTYNHHMYRSGIVSRGNYAALSLAIRLKGATRE
jgi:CRISPR-associated protein Csx14